MVIPSRGRPTLLRRALASVSSQTVAPREVTVVLDGADAALEAELRRRGDLPLRVVVVDPPRGGAHARNVGVESLDSPLVAFLDDDDVWLPRKLERQLPLMEQSEASYTRVAADEGRSSSVAPALGIGSTDVSEYLFDRRRPWGGAGLILTSTILAHTDLMRRVAFDASLAHHHDWDWALRAGRVTRLAFCGEVLTIWHVDEGRPRLSTDVDWRETLDWAQSRRPLFTPRAYSGFLLVNAYTIALRTSGRRAAPTLVREATARGAPTLSQWLIFGALTLLPTKGAVRLRSLTQRTGRRVSP